MGPAKAGDRGGRRSGLASCMGTRARPEVAVGSDGRGSTSGCRDRLGENTTVTADNSHDTNRESNPDILHQSRTMTALHAPSHSPINDGFAIEHGTHSLTHQCHNESPAGTLLTHQSHLR